MKELTGLYKDFLRQCNSWSEFSRNCNSTLWQYILWHCGLCSVSLRQYKWQRYLYLDLFDSIPCYPHGLVDEVRNGALIYVLSTRMYQDRGPGRQVLTKQGIRSESPSICDWYAGFYQRGLMNPASQCTEPPPPPLPLGFSFCKNEAGQKTDRGHEKKTHSPHHPHTLSFTGSTYNPGKKPAKFVNSHCRISRSFTPDPARFIEFPIHFRRLLLSSVPRTEVRGAVLTSWGIPKKHAVADWNFIAQGLKKNLQRLHFPTRLVKKTVFWISWCCTRTPGTSITWLDPSSLNILVKKQWNSPYMPPQPRTEMKNQCEVR